MLFFSLSLTLVSIYKTIKRYFGEQRIRCSYFCLRLSAYIHGNGKSNTIYKQQYKIQKTFQFWFRYFSNEKIYQPMRTLMSDRVFLNDLFITKCEILPAVEGEKIIQSLKPFTFGSSLWNTKCLKLFQSELWIEHYSTINSFCFRDLSS